MIVTKTKIITLIKVKTPDCEGIDCKSHARIFFVHSLQSDCKSYILRRKSRKSYKWCQYKWCQYGDEAID